MKCIARIFLFLFITFLSVPTILTLIEKTTNISVFFDVMEEEHVKKDAVTLYTNADFGAVVIIKKFVEAVKIPCPKFLKIDKILRIIFSPPPNLF